VHSYWAGLSASGSETWTERNADSQHHQSEQERNTDDRDKEYVKRADIGHQSKTGKETAKTRKEMKIVEWIGGGRQKRHWN
jgi:hypothetical protein